MHVSTVGDVILYQAAALGDKTFAFFSTDPPLSYRALAEESAAAAAALAAGGIAAGSRIALLFGPGPAQLISLAAGWTSGAMVSPIDRFISEPAFLSILADFRPDLILFGPGAEHRADLTRAAREGGFTVAFWPPSPVDACDFRPGSVDPAAPALCLYTSGSTGLPKGVVHSQAGLLHGAANQAEAQQVGAEDRALCVLPLSHMNGLVTTFLSPLRAGGSVVYLQQEFQPARVMEHLARFGCTWVSAAPTHYALLAAASDDTPPPPETLRFCRSAAAPLPENVLTAFERRYGAPIVETMGTTETAGQLFANPVPPGRRKVNSIGLPVGFEARIVGADGRPCGVDDVGEMQVRGPAMMIGYLNDPTETAKAFDGDWLKTGDLARVDADGYWFIVGRIKDIAIFCGLNISLRRLEIEAQKADLAVDVACVAEPHPLFGETVAAYAVPRGSAADYAADPAPFAETARRLAEVMHPHLPSPQALKDVRLTWAFPRSGAGKTLKGALAETPAFYRAAAQTGGLVSPKALLARLFAVEAADIPDDMALEKLPRWDSLAYVSLIAAVESVLSRHLEGDEIAALRTLPGLARVLGDPDAPPLPPAALLPLPSPSSFSLPAGRRGGAEKAAVDGCVSRLLDAGYGGTRVTYLIVGYDHCRALGVASPEALIDGLLSALPAGANVVMNAFTWRFCRGEAYHHRRTPCEVGLLNELFRRRDDVTRGPHPIYSYAAWGPDAAALTAHPGDTCWGEGSATRALLDDDAARVTTFGLPPLPGHGRSLLRANPCLHALEQMFNAPYRFMKTFSGVVDFGGGPRRYATGMYVRPLDKPVDNTWEPLFTPLAARPDSHLRADEMIFAYRSRDLREIGMELLARDDKAFFVERFMSA